MKIKNHKDFWSGLMFTLMGVLFALGATRYTVGTAAKMGPGYFPLVLGIVLAILGVIVLLESVTVETADGDPIGHFDWRTIALILGAVVLFGVLLQPAGLIVALAALVVVSSFASHEFTWKGTIINAVIMIVLCLVVFVWALKLQFPILPAFMR